MSENELRFEVVYPSRGTAEEVRAATQKQGARADIKEEPGLLPLAVLLIVAVPPGAALLIQVIGRVIRDFTRHGVVIDARGTDAPRITSEKDLPYGTVIILTRDGDQAKRTDLPEAKISEYVSAALTAVSGGASATGAAQQAGSQSGVGAASGVST